MDFLKDIKITPSMIMLLCYLCILSIHCLSVSTYVDAKNEEQIVIINNIQSEQQNIITKLDEVNEDIVNMKDYSASLNTIIEDLEELKQTTYEVKAIEFEAEMSALDKIEDKEKWFLEYKDICERYTEYISMPETIYDVFTEEEINRCFYMVQTEIGHGTFEQKLNVANVLWNRMNDTVWPNTIFELIKPGQFAYSNINVNESTRLAVEYSFMFPDENNKALAFNSNEKTEKFGSYYYLFSDSSGHNFYGPKEEE